MEKENQSALSQTDSFPMPPEVSDDDDDDVIKRVIKKRKENAEGIRRRSIFDDSQSTDAANETQQAPEAVFPSLSIGSAEVDSTLVISQDNSTQVIEDENSMSIVFVNPKKRPRESQNSDSLVILSSSSFDLLTPTLTHQNSSSLVLEYDIGFDDY